MWQKHVFTLKEPRNDANNYLMVCFAYYFLYFWILLGQKDGDV